MKKSRIFMAAGAVALAISAVFATKANKKFTSITSGSGSASNFQARVTGQTIFTTLQNSSLTVYADLVTQSGFVIGGVQLYTDKTNKVPILYKP